MAMITRCLFGVLCGCILLTACSESDDTTAIKTLVETGVKLAEQKSVGDLMDLTTEDFVAMPGRRGEREVKRILFAAFMHYGDFLIHYPRPDIDIADTGVRATVHFPFVIVRQNHDLPGLTAFYDDPASWLETVGEKADVYQLTLQLRKQDGSWLVVQAELHGYHHSAFLTQ